METFGQGERGLGLRCTQDWPYAGYAYLGDAEKNDEPELHDSL